jgi:hypothetical protein
LIASITTGTGGARRYLLPGLIRIEQVNALCDNRGASTKVLLINGARVVDHEGHDAGIDRTLQDKISFGQCTGLLLDIHGGPPLADAIPVQATVLSLDLGQAPNQWRCAFIR